MLASGMGSMMQETCAVTPPVPKEKVRFVCEIRPITLTTVPGGEPSGRLLTVTGSPTAAPRTNGHAAGYADAATVTAESRKTGLW